MDKRNSERTLQYPDDIVTNNDIPTKFQVTKEEDVDDLIYKTIVGDYISILNQNNLSEVFIYRRKSYDSDVSAEGIWNGSASTTHWYNDKDDVLFLNSAADFKGFADLVNLGCTFKGKEIRLMTNIDLAGKPWRPIGSGELSGGFKGVFNGDGHIIYELLINTNDKSYVGNYNDGLFALVYGGEVRNLTITNCHLIGDSVPNQMLAPLCGIAKDALFANIYTNGIIISPQGAGVCGRAIDTSFYNCKSSVTILGNSTYENSDVVLGGIAGLITLSKKMIEKLDNKPSKMFDRCLNEGSLYGNGRMCKSLSIGHLFGMTYYENDVSSFPFIIEQCTIGENTKISVINYDEITGESVFYGIDDKINKELDEFNLSKIEDYASNNEVSINVANNSKDDLLLGLIGKVDKNVHIELRRMTKSTLVKNMVIPGSINTLVSKSGDNTFCTISTERPTEKEVIYNLEPYFEYIKTIKK